MNYTEYKNSRDLAWRVLINEGRLARDLRVEDLQQGAATVYAHHARIASHTWDSDAGIS